MKKILPIILTIAFFATTAKAGLGWSLAECVQHYGKPESTTPLTDALTDLPSYEFKTKGFEITAVIGSEGKVVGITYFSHVMSEEDIDSLLAVNAPKAEWQKRASKNSASKGEEIDWIGLEDGSRKYSAWSWTINNSNANADVYGTKVLEIEAVEFEDLRKGYSERGAKPSRTGKGTPLTLNQPFESLRNVLFHGLT